MKDKFTHTQQICVKQYYVTGKEDDVRMYNTIYHYVAKLTGFQTVLQILRVSP